MSSEKELLEKILKELRSVVGMGKDVKNGEWKTDRALFEERTRNDLVAIKELLERYTNVMSSSTWFFKIMRLKKTNWKVFLLVIIITILAINLIQYIPLDILWDSIWKIISGIFKIKIGTGV